VGYKGSRGVLTATERADVVKWIKVQSAVMFQICA
jgi:hypothetical protein